MIDPLPPERIAELRKLADEDVLDLVEVDEMHHLLDVYQMFYSNDEWEALCAAAVQLGTALANFVNAKDAYVEAMKRAVGKEGY